MKRPVYSLFSPLVSALLMCTLTSGALAASPQHAALRHAPRMDSVKITITATSGTVWGPVTAKYAYQRHTTQRSCSVASCALRIPQGVTLHLSQVARNRATWPFKDWLVTVLRSTRAMMTNVIAMKVTGSMSVTAVYVVAQSSSSGNGW